MTCAEPHTESVVDSTADFFCSVIDSWGALVPYISIMETLQARGSRCVLCMPEDLRSLAEAASLTFVTDSTHLQELTQGSDVFETADNALRLLLESRQLLGNWIPNVMRATYGAIEAGRVDPSSAVVVSNSPGLLYLGPFWLDMGFSRFVCLDPYLLFDWLGRWSGERSQFLPTALPPWIGHLVLRGLFGQHGRSLATDFLGRRPSHGFVELRRRVVGQWHICSPQLFCNSSLALGYCYPSTSRELPAELGAFVKEAKANSQRIVLFTIGSMDLAESARVAMVSAFTRAIERATDTVGIVLGPGVSSSGSVFSQKGFVPYPVLFPQIDLIVCHGGAGTTHLALWAGVPVVVVPFLKDQFDWARRLDRLGILSALVPRDEFSTERLVAAFDGLRDEMVRHARRMGEIERTLYGDGRTRVVDALVDLDPSVAPGDTP